MKDIEDIISENSQKANEGASRKELASSIGNQFGNHLKENRPMNNVPTPKVENQISLNLQGIEKIEVRTIDIVGFEEALGKITDWISTISDSVNKFKVPNITVDAPIIPPIVVPKPEVTVNVPPAPQNKMIVRPNITVESPPSPKESHVVTEKEIYTEGFLDGWERKFDNGDVVRMTGASVGKRKYEYR